MVSPSINNSRARPKPIRRGMSAASTTEGMPTLTSGMPNCARVAGDPQVAGHRDFEPGAEREAVDARDHRHRQPAQAVAGLMHQSDEIARAAGIERRHFRDAGAADEGLVAGPAQHQRAQIRARVQAPRARR